MIYLFTADPASDLVALKSYLSELNLASLTGNEAESLETPLTLLEEALGLIHTGKSPGLDGLPPKLFLKLWDIVGPLLLDSLNYALDTGSFHRDQISDQSCLRKINHIWHAAATDRYH